ncbi:MAG: RHS repeat-associated core domain-containing protein [Sphaerochaetaceae bacterium]|nr:RHS repeat-associated core domain-containing protein [Sphaerochaetaceae bacterium]
MYYSIPSFSEYNTGYYDLTMYYNGYNDYQDIYELDLNENPTLTFKYYDNDNQVFITSLTTTLTYSNLDITEEGYYYRRYTATDGFFYDIEFKIVFKVGNPVNGDRVPQEHIHYNYSSDWEDQLLSYGEIEYIDGVAQTEVTVQEYTYDSQGNPTEITNFVYNGVTYDRAYLSWSGRKLSVVTIMQGYSTPLYQIRYKYNDQGYRTQKSFYTYSNYTPTLTQTIDYELIDDRVAYETDGVYGILYTYDYDGTLISFNYDSDITDQNSGDEYFYIRNQMGDITHLATEDGTVVVHYVYDAYGNIVDIDSETGYSTLAEMNPYRYRGYRYDTETNLYYLNSRYYNPEFGRFISFDVLLGVKESILSTNMYTYCLNDPINSVDTNGYMSSWLKIGLLSLAVVAVVAVTVATFGATSVLGVAAITGAINIGAQTATVAVAQYHKSKEDSLAFDDSLDLKTINDVGDAVADCFDDIILMNLGIKAGFTTAFTVHEIASSSTAIGVDSAMYGVSKPEIWAAYAEQKANSTTYGQISIGFSLYNLSKTVIAFLDKEKAYEYAEEYGWTPQ